MKQYNRWSCFHIEEQRGLWDLQGENGSFRWGMVVLMAVRWGENGPEEATLGWEHTWWILSSIERNGAKEVSRDQICQNLYVTFRTWYFILISEDSQWRVYVGEWYNGPICILKLMWAGWKLRVLVKFLRIHGELVLILEIEKRWINFKEKFTPYLVSFFFLASTLVSRVVLNVIIFLKKLKYELLVCIDSKCWKCIIS